MTVASERAIRRLCWAAVVAWRTRLNDLRAARSILDSRLRSPAPAASVVSWTREVKFAIAVSIRRRTPASTSLAGAVPSAPSMPSSQQVTLLTPVTAEWRQPRCVSQVSSVHGS